jgi:hypothetical protein
VSVMKRLHLIFGLVVLVAFVLTGQYMDIYHRHLEGMADGPRMLYRSRHIFILLASLLNLGLGAYVAPRLERRRRALQWLGSVLITAATVLFVAGFFYEPGLEGLETPLSQRGAYAILAGTLLHLLSGAGEAKKV